MNAHRTAGGFAGLTLAALLPGCVSPETRAKIDEYERTIPVCAAGADCRMKWRAARAWTVEHADFPVFTESEDRIMASSTLISGSGVGVVVTREPAAGGYRLLVDIECFSATVCPDRWELMLDFNRAVAAAR